MNRRNYETFYKDSGVAGIKNVARAYAFEADTTTFDVLSERFNITNRAVRHCIEHAIVNCMIDYESSVLIKEKAHRNQTKHMNKSSVRTLSDKYYEELFRRRLAYVRKLSNEKVIEIAHLYMANHNVPIKEIARSLNLSSKEVNIVLVRAITNNLVEEYVIRTIYSIALMKSKSIPEFNSRYDYFEKLETVRKSVTK